MASVDDKVPRLWFCARFLDPRVFPRASRACRLSSLCGWLEGHRMPGMRPTRRACWCWTDEGVRVAACHYTSIFLQQFCSGDAAMASGGKAYYAAQAASSSSSRGDPAPGWNAADSFRQVAAQRAAQWREAEGLQDDNDFTYAYLNYDQVANRGCRPSCGR